MTKDRIVSSTFLHLECGTSSMLRTAPFWLTHIFEIGNLGE
jgi:hypothetical protein